MHNNDYTRVKEALSIVDVIGRFVSLKKKGSHYVGLCPFHEDRDHPSMSVSPSRQTYKCWSCGVGGDVIEFIKQHEHYANSYEALEWCARQAGIQIDKSERTPEDLARQKEIESERVAIEASCRFFEEKLPLAAAYLKKRGHDINSELLKSFRVGYAPEGNLLYRELTAKGHTFGQLAKVNVCKVKEYGYKYDVFRDRITFPFLDLQGRVTGFSGRLCTPREGAGKYLNTTDTNLFKKKKTLFGFYQAKRDISRMDFAYLVEGQFDVLSFHAAGLTNTVGTSGTAFDIEQVKLLKRFTKNVTLCFDGDLPGMKALRNSCELLLSEAFTVRCVLLPPKKDPDEIFREKKSETAKWVSNHTKNFLSYFATILAPKGASAEQTEEALELLIRLIAAIPSETLRLGYIKDLAKRFDTPMTVLERKLKSERHRLPEKPDQEMKPGIYGMDLLAELPQIAECLLTDDFNTFIESVDDTPVAYINGIPALADIQQLRKLSPRFETASTGLSVSEHGEESPYLAALAACYRAGITLISITLQKPQTPPESPDSPIEPPAESLSFILYYCKLYKDFFDTRKPSDRSEYISRCADLLSYAEDSVRIVNFAEIQSLLGLTATALKDILKPYIAKRKARLAINMRRPDEEEEIYDPGETPRYVDDNPEYKAMYHNYDFFPYLNREGRPVCYGFRNSEGARSGFIQVCDFFIEPLLHIKSDSDDSNNRVVRLNHKRYKTPVYAEINSRDFTALNLIDVRLNYLGPFNFLNCDTKRWAKIRAWLSYKYVECSEISVYGNQQADGTSRLEKNMFYAFANGIFHIVDGVPRFDPADELGVVTHNSRNYYLPAYSSIYAGRDFERFENISKLKYNPVPVEKQCSFQHWAHLMNSVYKLNDNGKWALLFAVMSAFRSNIYSIDRLFTAPFFMGPMSSGKTAIALSVRALYISPKEPIFNLIAGSPAALSTLVGNFRDVPVVLDEYNNREVSDAKFQTLKGIVYDGDGKQKRRGVGSREIENDKVFAPVIICGQETPQRDDNALMSRIIVCEVAKPRTDRTPEERQLFNELKDLEDPNKTGLSNILFEILKLRPLVMEHFRHLKSDSYDDLKDKLSNAGEIDRIMKTVSLFLATCQLIENYTELKLPFTYAEFLQIAIDKIKFQIELITSTDKLATFFKAMDVMIDTKAVREGRDFSIGTPDKITIKLSGDDKKEVAFPAGTRILFLRINKIYPHFARSSYNTEESTQSTIEQNLRSHPSYIGRTDHRFSWLDVVETPSVSFEANGEDITPNNTMVRRMERHGASTSCIALNYDIFRDLYDIDLQRSDTTDPAAEIDESDKPF
ncbi:MAG: DNA primase [Tannerella sp.]|jgi:DNA primase catalytic core|nr:DNA primase [Tannerella sp.]